METGFPYEKTIGLMNTLVPRLAALREGSGRRGGFLCVLRRLALGASPLLHVLIGRVPTDKTTRCFTLSHEKSTRLKRHLSAGHLTSWESRDPSRDRYGGAIAGTTFLYGFSGFSEDDDSALMIALALQADDLSWEDAKRMSARITPMSENVIRTVRRLTPDLPIDLL